MSARGFTIVELILTIVLIGILFGLGSLVLIQGLDSYAHIFARNTTLQRARYAMERMVREIRIISDQNNSLRSIQGTQLSFIDAASLETDFHWTGQTLWRGNDRLSDDVTALNFTGFRDDNVVTSAAPQVRRVRIQLTVAPPGQTAPLVLRTDIFLRNYIYENFR